MARLVLAATLAPSYGIYSGYENFENVPVREGSEEYLNSEKYETRERTLDGPLLPMIRRINEIRHENPALQILSNVFWLETHNDGLIAYVKQVPGNAFSSWSTSILTIRRRRSDDPGADRPAARLCCRGSPHRGSLRLAHRLQLRAARPGRRRQTHICRVVT